MKAIVTHASGLLGASLIRALRWEGHQVTAVVPTFDAGAWMEADPGITRAVARPSDADDVVFELTPGALAVVGEGTFAQFSSGELLAPGEPQESAPGRYVAEFLATGRVRRAFGGARLTDARDLALAMVSAAEGRISGCFTVAGPWVDYEELLGQLEWMTGSEARAGGTVVLTPGFTELIGVPFVMALRPVRETLADVVAWHSNDSRSVQRVA